MQTPDAHHETPLTPTELYEGVLHGTAIGDALGLACEGLSAGVIAKRFGRVDRYRLFGAIGWVSDDTEQSALVERGDVLARPASFSWPMALARNLALYPVVLAHGLRRLAPPYR